MKVFLEHTLNGVHKFFVNSNYRRFIRFSIFHGDKKRYKAKTIRFNKFEIYTPDRLSFIWQYKEIFADQNYKFNSSNREPIIIDCGANIGISCLFFASIFPKSKIIAIEADPIISTTLRENLRKNNISNVEIISKAVWIHNDGVELSLEGADGATIYSDKNLIRVESIRLKELLDKKGKIDLLKMDIEGAEYEVLMDCKQSINNVENVFIEYHSFIKDSQKLSAILDVLEKNNFRYFIKPVTDRGLPFIIKTNKSNPEMDLQLNIFAYRI